jgi:uncharacterized protein with gpF-like domain
MARVLSIPPRRWRKMMRDIERGLEAEMAAELARAYVTYLRTWEDTGALVPDLEHERRVDAILTRRAEIAIRAFGGETDRILRKAERKDFAQTLMKLARRYISLEGFRRRITSIAETTREQIIGAVERGFQQGLGQQGVAKYVNDLIPQFTRARAGVIARTETHGAANYGAQGAAAETGLALRKVWIAAEDERTRPDHVAADGQTVEMDDAFQVGDSSMQFPGDPTAPADQVINCRCVHGFVPID